MQPCQCCRAVLERCSSGLRGTPGKRVYSKRVSGVRISFSPQMIKENQRQVNLNADFLLSFAPPRRRRREMSERQRTKSPREGGVQGRLRERCRSDSERNLREKETRGTACGRCRSDSERNLGETEACRTACGRCRSDSDEISERRRRAGPPTGDVGATANEISREGGVQDRLRTRPVISDDDLLNHRR